MLYCGIPNQNSSPSISMLFRSATWKKEIGNYIVSGKETNVSQFIVPIAPASYERPQPILDSHSICACFLFVCPAIPRLRYRSAEGALYWWFWMTVKTCSDLCVRAHAQGLPGNNNYIHLYSYVAVNFCIFHLVDPSPQKVTSMTSWKIDKQK